MTKTNRFTLIATVLLGILLFTIVRFANDLNVAWNGARLPSVANTNTDTPPAGFESATADLNVALQSAGFNPTTARAAATRWRHARGFPEDTNLTTDQSPGAGDWSASQALAEQRRYEDLPGALALFELAAEQGSTYALLRIAALLEALDAATAESPDTIALLEFESESNLQLSALGYVITGIRDAGLPIIDADLAAQIARLTTDTSAQQRAAACAWSERRLLDIARARARQGIRMISTDVPPVFLTAPAASDRLPCENTGWSIAISLDEFGCAVQPFRTAAEELLDLWICTHQAAQ